MSAFNFFSGGENFSAIIVGSGFSGIDIAKKLKEAVELVMTF